MGFVKRRWHRRGTATYGDITPRQWHMWQKWTKKSTNEQSTSFACNIWLMWLKCKTNIFLGLNDIFMCNSSLCWSSKLLLSCSQYKCRPVYWSSSFQRFAKKWPFNRWFTCLTHIFSAKVLRWLLFVVSFPLKHLLLQEILMYKHYIRPIPVVSVTACHSDMQVFEVNGKHSATYLVWRIFTDMKQGNCDCAWMWSFCKVVIWVRSISSKQHPFIAFSRNLLATRDH